MRQDEGGGGLAGRFSLPVLRRALSQLRQAEQDILVLRYLRKVDTREIAVLMDKTHIAARVALSRATKRLRAILKEFLDSTSGDGQ